MKRLIVFILLLAFMFAIPAGCKDSEETENLPQPLVDAQLIGGFSCYDEMRTIIPSAYFGILKINKDEKFITEGDASLKMTVLNQGNEASLKFMTGTKYNILTDYSNVCALTMDFFNDSDVDRNVYVNFGTRESGYNRSTYPEKAFVLKPGHNLVIYEIDRGVSHSTTYVNKVEYIGIRFDLNKDQPYDIYLDNMIAHFDDSAVTPSVKEYAENEILLFDDGAWLTYISTVADMSHPSEVATILPCRNPKYIKGGKGSMQIKNAKEVEGSGDINSPGVVISGEAIERIDWTKVQSIEFDVCTDASVGNISFGLSDSNGTRHTIAYAMRWHNEELIKDGGFIPGKWYHVSLDLDKMINGEYLNGDNGQPLTTTLEIKNINKLHFWNSVIGEGQEDFSFYVDELKVVPKAETPAE